MGNLPQARFTQSRPFTHVGIDFCGPFILKERKHRNRGRMKIYVAVFICLASKAVHLEVSDLTTDAFIAALRRFISRRGHCSNKYSDNGTNFVGANRELKELHQFLTLHDGEIKNYFTTKGIKWQFNPPVAPHTGGLWEAAVNSFKRHLKHVANTDLVFTLEEFDTLVIEIEAILNSRPLTPISIDPNDPLVLTSGHFLIGDSLTNLPEWDFTYLPFNRLSTWQHTQQVKQHFWVRWQREYLNELTSRNKWNKTQNPIVDGSIVLLRDIHTPPAQWALGRVLKMHPGKHGNIRIVTVKTVRSGFIRNIMSLAPLPVQHNASLVTPTTVNLKSNHHNL